MRRRVLLAAGVMVTVLLLTAVIASAPPSAAISGTPADKPAKGDTWKYNITYYCEGVIAGIGNVTTNVAGTVDIKAGVNETEEYHCYNYTTTMEITSSIVNANMTQIMHTYYSMDGSVTAMHVHVETKTPTDTGITEAWLHFNDTWKMFDFPLEEGKTWSKNLSAYFIGWTNGTGTNVTYDWNNATPINYTFTGEVINVTEVNTGAGTFECWLVNLTNPMPFTVGSYSLIWYSPKVKNVVYREDYTGAFLISTWNLTSYSVSYPTHELIQTLTLLTLWNMQQQQQQTNMMIMVGVGVAVVVVVAGVAVYYLRRR